MQTPRPAASSTQTAQHAAALLKAGRAAEAEGLLKASLADHGAGVAAWMLLAKAQQMRNAFADMARSASAARELAPANRQAINLELDALVLAGTVSTVRQRIDGLAAADDIDSGLLARLSEVALQIGDYGLADSLLAQACALSPADMRLHYNRASTQVALGQMDAAEASLNRVLRHQPGDGDGWYNLATLRRQTATDNHLAALEEALQQTGNAPPAIPLNFAIAKQREDLGDHAASFRHLESGNAMRRAAMRYRVEDDAAAMAQIADGFGPSWAKNAQPAESDAKPIFVVGMPRSGTTLVDRILASHVEVESIGEVNDLALAIMEEAGAVASKADLIARSTTLDLNAFAANYHRRAAARAPHAKRIVDKTPLNFLYLGLIARAMPEAAIVHLRRDPMDIAFAVYKTLFRMGYPFAYALDDIARYMIAKHQLMAHWDALFPGRIIHTDYEALVSDQEAASRRLLTATGLDWDDAVLNFHQTQSASATASAAQVRQPIHRRSVGAWRRHEAALQPLHNAFKRAGMIY